MHSALLTSLLLLGCVPATETFVVLDADPELQGPGTLLVRWQPDDGAPASMEFETGPDFWPHELAFHPRGGDATRRFMFEAFLLDGEGQIRVGARMGFGRSQNRVEFLFERACRDVLCRDGFVCRNAVCVPALPTPAECSESTGVCDPVTSCGCEPGLECVRSEDDELACQRPAPSEVIRCAGPSDCSEGEVCHLATGQCSLIPAATCEAPTSADGAATLGSLCADHDDCATGLLCVGALQPVGDDEDLQYSQAGGRCIAACDPCVPSLDCAAPHECVALPGGGGFCARGGLADEGEACRQIAGVERFCAPGLTCRTGRCVRLCRGEFAEVAGGNGHCTALSPQCAEDQVCEGPTSNPNWGWCVARPPEFPSLEGGSCGVADACPCPLRCISQNDGRPRFCERRGITSCDECPAGTLCRETMRGNEPAVTLHYACVAPGSLARYDPCDATEQCQAGLTCDATGSCQPE